MIYRCRRCVCEVSLCPCTRSFSFGFFANPSRLLLALIDLTCTLLTDLNPVLLSGQVEELVGVLNASNITSNTEVVVAPPSVYLHGVSQKLRGDVKV